MNAKCPAGHEVWWGAKYCGTCGVPTVQEGKYCPYCGKEVTHKADSFCTICGGDMTLEVTVVNPRERKKPWWHWKNW